MSNTKKSITARVREVLEPYTEKEGYEIWNVEYIKAGKDWQLIVYCDSPGGMGSEDCEKISRYLDAKLDEEDLIEGSYYLIVSSPGMDRQLLTDEHFVRYTGRLVDVSLYKGVDGSKKYCGFLTGRSEDELLIKEEVSGEQRSFPRDSVSSVRLAVRI